VHSRSAPTRRTVVHSIGVGSASHEQVGRNDRPLNAKNRELENVMTNDSQLQQAVQAELKWEPSVTGADIGVTAHARSA